MSADFSTSPDYLEWKEARTIIDSIDDRLNDLRKYGLSFVSALLTAQALIDSSQPSSSTYVPPGVKLAIILASLVLICVLYNMEVINRQIQHAASVRSRALEKKMKIPMGLTAGIARTFAVYHVDRALDALYVMMLGATGVLGYFVLGGGTFSWSSLIDVSVGATIVAGIFVVAIHFYDRIIELEIELPRGVRSDVWTAIQNLPDGPALLKAYETCREAILSGLLAKSALEAENTVRVAITIRGRQRGWPLEEWTKKGYRLQDYLRVREMRGDLPRTFAYQISSLSKRSDEERVLHPAFLRDEGASKNAWRVLSDLTRLLNGWFLITPANESPVRTTL